MVRNTRMSVLENEEVFLDEEILDYRNEISFEKLLSLLGDDVTSEGKLKTLQFLAKYGLIINARYCEECPDNLMSLNKANTKDGYEWRCAACRKSASNDSSKRISVRRGSFFTDSKLSLNEIIKLLYFWSTNTTIDYSIVKNVTGINGPETINHYYNIINDFCQNFIEKYQTKEQLQGIIEIEYGKKFEKTIIMFERHSNKVKHFISDYSNIHQFMRLIIKNIVPGSTIITQGSQNYGGLSFLKTIFAAEYPNMNITFVDNGNQLIGNHIAEEVYWSSLKHDLQAMSKKMSDLSPTWIYHYYFKRCFNFHNIFANFIVEIRKSFPFDLYHCILHCLEATQEK
uniref:Uncharacterized protein n=1 Tax=Panagrolaimus sp. ES5 TaxID=591445 RepID=A0AC34FL60_9BILA